jgi:hypothetical protein
MVSGHTMFDRARLCPATTGIGEELQFLNGHVHSLLDRLYD